MHARGRVRSRQSLTRLGVRSATPLTIVTDRGQHREPPRREGGRSPPPLHRGQESDRRPVLRARAPAFPRLSSPAQVCVCVGRGVSSSCGPVVVYLFVNAHGEDIPVPQRLLAKHQAVVELLDWLVAPGGSVRVGQADQLSAPRMQLRRHLQWAANIRDSGDLRQLLALRQRAGRLL